VTQAGYSGTPLPRKLGLANGQLVVFAALPAELDWIRSSVDFSAVVETPHWQGAGAGAHCLDVVIAFVRRRAELEAELPAMMGAIKPAGMIWVCWPKRAAKVATDMTEDVVREIALPLGLVDVKVCAVDATWSGLKLVIRRDRR
jgi:hypothetical protein